MTNFQITLRLSSGHKSARKNQPLGFATGVTDTLASFDARTVSALMEETRLRAAWPRDGCSDSILTKKSSNYVRFYINKLFTGKLRLNCCTADG